MIRNRGKNCKHDIWQFLRMPFFISILFYLCLVIVYCIPSSAMQGNVYESYEILAHEGLYYSSYADGHTYDNHTVARMLNLALNTGKNPFVAAIRNERNSGSNPISELNEVLSKQGEKTSYCRYWHGYLVFLKPLLCFLNVYQIRLLCEAVIIILLMGVGISLKDRMGKNGVYISLALAFSWGIFSGVNAAITLPMFSCFAVSLVGCIYVLRCLELRRKHISKAFFLIGSVTVYLDFLDNPILTLGIPLCILILRMLYDSKDKKVFLLRKEWV